jgi:hypothetical protein
MKQVSRVNYACLIRWPERALKSVTWLVMVAYLSVNTIQPAVASIKLASAVDRQNALEQASITPAEHYARALSELKQLLLKSNKYPDNSALQALAALNVETLLTTLDTQRIALDSWWQSQAQQLRNQKVASAVIAGQQKIEQAWREKDRQLQTLMKGVRLAAPIQHAQAQNDLLGFLQREVPDRRPNHVDHDNLPWQVQKDAAREPLLDAQQLRALLAKPRAAMKTRSDKVVAAKTKQLGKAIAHTTASTAAKSSSNPAQAAMTAPLPPTAADLAATIDAPFTADIKQKAIDLGSNPVRIFNWVHDSIGFFPSYGSVQGAQDTLDKQSGNAFDQASLLIAMLRSSGIPARYVYGTVDLPTAQAQNWVGGVQDVDSAQQILGQGGIPNIALTSGGVVKAIRIEHVWVEAFVPSNPARGAVNGSGDTWVPLDPSFKQYLFTQGMNISQGVPFDAQGFMDAAQQGASVNQNEGWVQNLNQANIQSSFKAYQTQVGTYISATKPSATVSDVYGGQTIRAQHLSILPASSPYVVQTLAARYAELPDALRHHFDYQIYPDANSDGYEDPVLDWNVPTVSIAGKKITMAWVAATQADADAIISFLPKGHDDGSPLQPGEMPTGLPASIHVTLELRVEGVKVASGGTYTIGTELSGAGAFTTYADLSQYDQTQDGLIAGQQSALGVSIQGISSRQLSDLQARMSVTKAKLAAKDNSNLTGDMVTGDILTSTLWSYFSTLQVYAGMNGRNSAMIDRPGLSYGLFHAVAQPIVLYGILTTGVSFKGVNMDVGHMRNIRWVKTGGADAQKRWSNYNQISGQNASAMENSVPERMLIDKTQCQYVDPSSGTVVNPALAPCQHGVSAAKALTIAANLGQKIFTITQANAAVAIPQLQQSSSVIADVQSAVASGKTVTIHQSPINTFGWSGAGYIETDTSTGAGAYLIEGAGNGGFLKLLGDNSTAIAFFSFVGGLVVAAFFEVFLVAFLIIALIVAELIIYQAYLESVESAKCDAAVLCIQHVAILLAAAALVFGVIGIFAEAVVALVLGLLGLIYADDLLKAMANGCNSVACPSGPADLD